MDEHTREVLFASTSGEYGTPDWVYKPLDDRFHFTLDAAASHEGNAKHKTPLYYTKEGLYSKYFSTPSLRTHKDGLTGAWGSGLYAWRGDGGSDFLRFGGPRATQRVWLNPPYGRGIEDWVRKCAVEAQSCKVVVALLPARTETDWFQRWVFPYAEVHFLMGRIRFVGGASSAPFPSVIAVYQQGLDIRANEVRAFRCDLKSSQKFDGGIGSFDSPAPLTRPAARVMLEKLERANNGKEQHSQHLTTK